MRTSSLIFTLGLLAGTAALAGPVVPTYTTFGNLAGATFGGNGIPTDPTAITTISTGSDTITLGLTAFGRFQNPPISNNGAGTFTAGIGVNDGLGATPQLLGTTWGFGYYISIVGGGSLDDYQFDLKYDFAPGAATDESLLGTWNLTATAVYYNLGGATVWQDAQNLYFGFLATSVPGYLTPPAGSFNAYAAGEYSLALVASSGGTEIGRSAILVNTVPEAGASAALLTLGLGGLLGLRRRFAAA